MARHYRKRLKKFTHLLRDLGFKATIQSYVNRFSKRSIVSLNVANYENPIYYRRKNRTDLNLLRKILCHGAGNPGLLIPGGLIIDAGANVGYVTIALAKSYPGCRILAIEPDRENYQVLTQNTAKLPQVQTVLGALWSESGSLCITNPAAKSVSFQVSASGEGELVRAYSITDLMELAGADSVSLLKMDIEGAEFELFKNHSENWFNSIRFMMVELHERYAPGLDLLFNERLSSRPHERKKHDEYEVITFLDCG